MTFLVVDDSRPTRNLIKNYVGAMSLGSPSRFLEAENGEAALLTLASYGVDFVFLDWNMSTKMTGLDVLKEIRKLNQHTKTPVFMITSESDKYNVIEALKFGANDFIAKPIDQKAFSDKLMKLIKGKAE